MLPAFFIYPNRYNLGFTLHLLFNRIQFNSNNDKVNQFALEIFQPQYGKKDSILTSQNGK